MLDPNEDQLALDDFIDSLSDEDLIAFIQSEGEIVYGPEVN